VLGVVLGIALLEILHGEALPLEIEIVCFSEEEGVRFGLPFIGSRALVGELSQNALATTDGKGTSVREAIQQFGLNADELPEVALKNNILGYLEFHIEQGPVLDELGLPLGVVEAIAGQSRLEIAFFGRANHAGTTPMRSRRDAIAGAAEWITAVEQQARRTPGLVATVGDISARPGATNVIAREARLSLDVRHRDDHARTNAAKIMIQSAQQIASRRGLALQQSVLLNQPSVRMDSHIVSYVEEAIRRAGCRLHRMTSGAGHDAMIVGEKLPAAMVFLRSPGGISHSPEETVEAADVEKAIAAGIHLLEILGSSPALQKWGAPRA
jgi:allantoate deiminase